MVSVLLAAAQKGHYQILEMLLQTGKANVNQQDQTVSSFIWSILILYCFTTEIFLKHYQYNVYQKLGI